MRIPKRPELTWFKEHMEEDEENTKSIPRWVELEYAVLSIQQLVSRHKTKSLASSICELLQDRMPMSNLPPYRKHPVTFSTLRLALHRRGARFRNSHVIATGLRNWWNKLVYPSTKCVSLILKPRKNSLPRTVTVDLNGFCLGYEILNPLSLSLDLSKYFQGILGTFVVPFLVPFWFS